MKPTLLGEFVSDVTSSAQEVNGIGDQFHLIERAFALEGARSLVALPATRIRKGADPVECPVGAPARKRGASLAQRRRDGFANLRGQRDEVAIAQMLAVAHSRCQNELLEKAGVAGKIDSHFRQPDSTRDNTPKAVRD